METILFARSSPEMHKRLLGSRVFGKYISDYLNNRPVPVRQKTTSIFFIWLGLGLTFYFANLPHWVIALLFFIGVVVSIHISMLGKY